MVGPPFNGSDFAAFLDDAAVFPPGNASVVDAVNDHLVRRTLGWGVLVGPLVVGAAHVPGVIETLDEIDTAGEPLAVSVVVRELAALPTVVGDVLDDSRLVLAGLEIASPGLALTRTTLDAVSGIPDDVVVHVEPGWGADLRECIGAIAESGRRLKLRTGGTEASAFPQPSTLAEAISAAADAQLPFKATAGLHHAVRHLDPATSFEHHGFLNLLLAGSVTSRGASAVQAALELRDGEVLAREVRDLGTDGVADVRTNAFTSFGTCDVREPYDDLLALGLLEPIGD